MGGVSFRRGQVWEGRRGTRYTVEETWAQGDNAKLRAPCGGLEQWGINNFVALGYKLVEGENA